MSGMHNPDWDRPADSRYGPFPQSPAQLDLCGLQGEMGPAGMSLLAPPPPGPAGAGLGTWVKVTSAISQTIHLTGGATTSGYPALLESYSAVTGAWSDGATCWFVGANGEVPVSGSRYLVGLAAFDASGVGIYSTEVAAATGITVENTDGSLTLTNVPDLKVEPAFNLSGVSSARAQIGLGVQYVYGTMTGSLTGSTTVPDNGGSNTGGLTGAFGSAGGVLTWATPGVYLVTFHTSISCTLVVLGGTPTFTSVSAALSIQSNYDSAPNPPNDTAGTTAEEWFFSSPASGTTAGLLVSIVQLVSVKTQTQVLLSGSVSATFAGGTALVSNTTTSPYVLWGMRVSGPIP